MRATWVCLSLSLPRQCVNYKKPRDDVHTHTQSRDGAPKFYFSTTQWQRGEREKREFLFLVSTRGLCSSSLCVCVICIFFRKGCTLLRVWDFSLSPLRARYFLWFRFIFVFRQIPSGRGSCVPFDSFSQPSFSQTLFYLLAPRNKKKPPSVLNLFFCSFSRIYFFSFALRRNMRIMNFKSRALFFFWWEKSFYLSHVVQLNDTESQSSAMTLWFYFSFFFVSLSF